MRNAWRMGIALLCLGLWLGMGARAMASEGTVPTFDDGDVVGFIGDSITHVTYSDHGYVELMEQYYLSRFPERRIEFRNLGVDGHKASDFLDIYDVDPGLRGLDRAVIMLGTNEAILGLPAEEYIGEMERLIGRLKEDGLAGEDILILSPPICDENWAGNSGWAYEDRVLEYMEKLEDGAREWGVGYLDFHTPMARLTAQIQEEDAADSLTRDSIHPNAMGHRMIAFYILRAQGFGDESLSESRFLENDVTDCARDELKDFYRGEKGMCGTLHPQTLPVADEEELSAFRDFIQEGDILYSKRLQVEGLQPEISYQLFMGEAELGEFTGEAFGEGIDLAVLDSHPQQETMRQIAALGRERHQRTARHRNMWVEVMMQRASYTPEQAQAAYDSWRTEDEQLRSQMYALAEDMAEEVFELAVVEKGYPVLELEQERAQAQELARQQAQEQARRERQELSARLQGKAVETVVSLRERISFFTRRMGDFPFWGKPESGG